MVELGYYHSLSDAVAAGYSPDRGTQGAGGLAAETLSARLAQRVSPLTAAAQGEGQ